MSSSREERLAPLLVFAAICALYALPVLHNPSYWGKPDWDQFTFWSAVPREIILRYHQFPLWNPFSNGGNAALAMPHSSFLSPQFLLVLLFGPILGLKLQWISALFVGLLGMHALSRRMGMGKLSSYLPPLVFMLSSHFSLHLREGHVEWIVLALVPWAFLFYLRSFSERRGFALTALALALMLYSGGVYVFSVTAFFLGIHAAATAVSGKSARPLARLSGLFALVFLLAAAKLVPMLELLKASPRHTEIAGLMEPRTAASAFLARDQNRMYEHPEDMNRSLGLETWGKDREKWHEFGAYIGLLPLLLALLGIRARWRNDGPLLLAGAACFWVACGLSPPVSLWNIIHHLPIYDSLHVPSRFLLGVLFCAALLAGFGCSELERSASGRRRGFLIAGLLVVFLDLFSVIHPVLTNAFPIPPEAVVRGETFQQGSADDAIVRHGSTSAMYPALLANHGAVDSYDIVRVPQGDIRTSWSRGYRGEAYAIPSGDPVRVVRFSPNEVAVALDGARGAALLLNQNYFPGWKVRAGGREEPARSINGLIAVTINPGDSEFTFVYRPFSFVIGLALTGLGLLMLFPFLRPEPDAPIRSPREGSGPAEISAVLPALDESGNAAATIERLHAALAKLSSRFEIIVVDDGSADGTAAVVEELARRHPEVRLVRHETNRGYGAAVRSGLAASRFGLIFLTDADGQFDPAELSKFLPFAAEHDLVIGWRRERAEGWGRGAAARVWSFLVGGLLGIEVKDVNCAFKLMRADAVKDLQLTSDGAAISAELLLRARRRGASWIELPVEHLPRRRGRATGARPAVAARGLYELLKLAWSRP